MRNPQFTPKFRVGQTIIFSDDCIKNCTNGDWDSRATHLVMNTKTAVIDSIMADYEDDTQPSYRLIGSEFGWYEDELAEHVIVVTLPEELFTL